MIKTVGLTFGITGFFAVYFWVLNHPVFPVTVMPLTAVDRLIGFRPWALPLYLSLWIYVPFAVVLARGWCELSSYGIAAFVLSAIGLGIFFLWPTAVPVLPVDWANHPSFAFLKSVDAAGNACPSLHVAFAVFTAIRLGRLLDQMLAGPFIHAANWLWCLGIAYSTVATGQHVALDVGAGAGLGAVVAGVWRGRVVGAGRLDPATCSGVGTTQR
ncbi:MAG: phosphatase PAP2 family protein [Verrucomicrobia bacterium]|nr:phosphatase PAP2 family protein [Verrucomicrobiota bacterium]